MFILPYEAIIITLGIIIISPILQKGKQAWKV